MEGVRVKTKHERFMEIYHLMYDELLWYACSHVRDKAILDDILQETFKDVYISFEEVLKADNYRAWIYCCLKNNMNEMLRKEIRYQRNCISYENEMELIETDNHDFAEEVTQHEALKQVLGDENYREFSLHYVEGYSVSEIAQSRNQSEGQYRMQISRLRKKMEKRLKRHGFDES